MLWTKSVLAGLILVGVTGSAMAADYDVPPPQVATDIKYYGRVDIGWSFADDKKYLRHGHRDAFVGGIGAGMQWMDMVRLDVRGDWSGKYKPKYSNRKTDVTTILGNVYFDIPLGMAIEPYVGGGAGYGWVGHGGGSDHKRHRDGFAYAGMVGFNFAMTDTMMLDVGYRYRGVSLKHKDLGENQAMVGVRMGF